LEEIEKSTASKTLKYCAPLCACRNIDLPVCAPSGVALRCIERDSGFQTRWAHRLQAYVPICPGE
jgi:hypothetical protein